MQDVAYDPELLNRNVDAIGVYSHKKFNIKSNNLSSIS
jgi:hypothetical protein